jgi:hypothetical protein
MRSVSLPQRMRGGRGLRSEANTIRDDHGMPLSAQALGRPKLKEESR